MPVLRLALFTILCAASAAGQDYCSLVVQVVDRAGNKLSKVEVSVKEGGGRFEIKDTENGDAKFCGLGVRGATITVGRSSACQVVVHNVPLPWGRTNEVRVLYDPYPCSIESLPGPPVLCSILFRFVDADGKQIAGVRFELGAARLAKLRSDQYGRTRVDLANEETLHLRTVKEGYLPETIDATCSRVASLEPERSITLRRSAPPSGK